MKITINNKNYEVLGCTKSTLKFDDELKRFINVKIKNKITEDEFVNLENQIGLQEQLFIKSDTDIVEMEIKSDFELKEVIESLYNYDTGIDLRFEK